MNVNKNISTNTTLSPLGRAGEGLRIAILGSGESGVGAAILAQAKGFDVFVSDKGEIKEQYKTVLTEKNIAFEEGVHTEEKILNAS